LSFRDYWDQRARERGRDAPSLITGGEEQRHSDEALLKKFDEVVADCNDLLDIGCGCGRLYPVLSKHCQRYTGIDFSEEMLRLFPALRSQDQILFVDSAAKLPIPNGSFDAVISSVFLQHIVNNEEFLSTVNEIKRVLRPKGSLYMVEAMTQGVILTQPVDYQRLRPINLYKDVFRPEIELEDRGIVHGSDRLMIGQRRIIEINENEEVAIDIGSGRNKVHSALGLDRRRVYSYGRRITDIQADACYLPFKDQTIDEVWCCGLIEHSTNPYPALMEIWRVLKPKGRAVIEVPYAGTSSAELDKDHKFVHNAEGWGLIFSGFFKKISCTPIGVRFASNSKWFEWQKKLINTGLWDWAQGGRYICEQPLQLPEIRYIPWWLEDYVKKMCGEDLV